MYIATYLDAVIISLRVGTKRMVWSHLMPHHCNLQLCMWVQRGAYVSSYKA